jgi:oligoribonuclease
MMILWVDLETTGLVPFNNAVLEVAAILTDSSLEEVDGTTRVIHFDNDTWRLSFDAYVQDMHSANGLWDECKVSTTTLTDVEQEIIQMLHDAGCSAETVILGGATINFDRAWIEQHMPILFNFLHYRNFDISTLKRCVEMWLPHIVGISPESGGIHRARPDIIESINYAKFFRDFAIHPKGLNS